MIDYIFSFIAPLFRISGQHFTILIVAIILFFLLFIDFGIILKNFLFSSFVSWFLAFGLSLIAAVSGVIAAIVFFLVGIAGYIGAILVLLGFKVGSSIIELSLAKRLKSDKKFREKIEEEAGLKMLRAVGKKSK